MVPFGQFGFGIIVAIVTLVAFSLASPAVQPPAPAVHAPVRTEFAQLSIRQSIILRVPVRPRVPYSQPRAHWVEKGSRKCVNVDDIAAANVISPSEMDLVMRGGERLRLKFGQDCPALSFYHGFYLRPGEDRQICARRDVVHPRSGGECEIETFKRLKLKTDD